MRLRNVKNKEEILNNSPYLIRDSIASWNKVFSNDNPLYIEIGMGKGKFILENAIKHPNINFIGIEKYDSVIAQALKKIDMFNINNLKVLRLDAISITEVFNKEVDLIYLNFSDPWPKKRHTLRRLSSPVFLEKYDHIFRGNGTIIMKTDNQKLFEYSLVSLSNYGYIIDDVCLDLNYGVDNNNITTEYEERFNKLNKCIYRVKAFKNK